MYSWAQSDLDKLWDGSSSVPVGAAMHILLLNPNTSDSFTHRIRTVACQYAAQDTQITTLNPSSGPRSIESVYDELLSVSGCLALLIPQLETFDGIVVACYSDHSVVYALREIADQPVIGIAEASMLMACGLGHRFSVVTTNEAWQPLLWDAVRRYGLMDRCASVRATGLPVLALEGKSEAELEDLLAVTAQTAMEQDQAEVICLGCAGMAGVDKRLQERLGIPVLDGVACGLKWIEGVVSYGVKTSKRRAYGFPQTKELVNLPPVFKTPYQ